MKIGPLTFKATVKYADVIIYVSIFYFICINYNLFVLFCGHDLVQELSVTTRICFAPDQPIYFLNYLFIHSLHICQYLGFFRQTDN